MKSTANFLKDLLFDILGGILFSLGYYTFSVNGGFAPGGVSGIALLLHHLTDAPVGLLTIGLNIPIVLVCARSLDRGFLLRSIRTSLVCAVLMDGLFPLLPAYDGQPILASLFTGLTAGAGMGIIYSRSSSTGGMDFVTAVIKKKNPHLSFGQVTLALDGVVILAGSIVFGSIDAVLYVLIATAALSFTMDWIVNGKLSGKMALIITRHGRETADAINLQTGRGSTLMPARGAYSGNALDVVLCACGRREIATVRRIAHSLDDHAMVMVCDATEVIGEGFLAPEVS